MKTRGHELLYTFWEISQRLIACTLLVIISPLFLTISVLIAISAGVPVFFIQERMGKGMKAFRMIKFRTMIRGAEKLQDRYAHLNMADGPVFKIRNDPRFTRIGRILSWTGLDEIPQFLNVAAGHMNLVGPRPLPISEARRLLPRYAWRFEIKPGITSQWIVQGTHNLPFAEWMKLDQDYRLHRSIQNDVKIILGTTGAVFKMIKEMIRV